MLLNQTDSRRTAIIDIGSNSIRLVVYDQQKRSPVPIYNEKVICALGKGLANTGKLNASGVEMAAQAVPRFLAMARNMEVASLHIMATSAVRDASDGKVFVHRLEKDHNISIDIISGEKEARLGAYGITASIHQPRGLTGDLGGGSFELVHLEHSIVTEQLTLPLGVLRLMDESHGDRDKMRKLVTKPFVGLEWLSGKNLPVFYAIGGSFRALARMHMQRVAYPLQIVHEYQVESADFLTFLAELLATTDERLEKWPGVSAKRLPALAPAALILEQLLQLANPAFIAFSASGIREGYLYEKLSPYLREQDGLLTSCQEVAVKSGRSPAYAGELMRWMQPLFMQESEQQRRMRHAFCLLSDVAMHIHPEYRAEYAWYRIFQSALTGISHRERVTLALALYHRYQFKRKLEHPALKLLQPADFEWARLVGTAVNLAYHLCGSIPGNLLEMPLEVTRKQVNLSLSERMKDLPGEAVSKRLNALREAYTGSREIV